MTTPGHVVRSKQLLSVSRLERSDQEPSSLGLATTGRGRLERTASTPCPLSLLHNVCITTQPSALQRNIRHLSRASTAMEGEGGVFFPQVAQSLSLLGGRFSVLPSLSESFVSPSCASSSRLTDHDAFGRDQMKALLLDTDQRVAQLARARGRRDTTGQLNDRLTTRRVATDR